MFPTRITARYLDIKILIGIEGQSLTGKRCVSDDLMDGHHLVFTQ